MADNSGAQVDDVQTAVRELSARVSVLAADLAALRSSLMTEVRTRRLAVVEERGFERVVLAASGGFGYVSVGARTDHPGSTCAELFANDPRDGDGASVGVALTNRGDVCAIFELVDEHRPALWIADDSGDSDP